jgi:hypothetical protein
VPNFGYILMVDSKYSDIDVDDLKKNSDNQVYKMYGSLYEKNGNLNITTINTLIYLQFKKLIDPDNFNHTFKIKGGSRPDDSIIALLKNMYNDSSSQSIRDFIPKFFGEFVHNRVGTLLLKSEKENVFTYSRPNFITGNLIIWEKRFNEFEWVIYIGDVSGNPFKKQILTKVGNTYEIIEVFISSLLGYPANEKVLPDSKKNMKYDESYIYETYTLDDLTKI